jgi:glyoxylase-like metal-dependent hydrolase (beta-lactamase superfamily II)
MRVTKDIFIFGGVNFSSNIYLIDNELLVDTGLGLYFEEIMASMLSVEVILENIKVILNTHSHCDHIRGNKKFRELTKGVICAHELDARNIETGKKVFCNLFSLDSIPTKVDKRLKEGDEIYTLNHMFKVIHTPGHTEGSICLYEPEKKILISGDTLFSDSVGRYDLEGGSKKDLVHSLKKLRKLEVSLLLPGHGVFKKGNISELVDKMLNLLEYDK